MKVFSSFSSRISEIFEFVFTIFLEKRTNISNTERNRHHSCQNNPVFFFLKNAALNLSILGDPYITLVMNYMYYRTKWLNNRTYFCALTKRVLLFITVNIEKEFVSNVVEEKVGNLHSQMSYLPSWLSRNNNNRFQRGCFTFKAGTFLFYLKAF